MDLALKAMDKSDYPGAISALIRCSELDADDTRPNRSIYDIHITTKQYDEAKQDIEYLLWLDPNDQDSLREKQLVANKIEYQ